MGRIKAFLKKDSDILRNTISLLFVLIFGISKLIYDHSVSAIFIGLVLIMISIFLFLEIIKELKGKNSVNVKKAQFKTNEKRRKLNNRILIVINLLFIWIFGLYFIFYKNDEPMVVLLLVFTYLILRDSFKKVDKHKE